MPRSTVLAAFMLMMAACSSGGTDDTTTTTSTSVPPQPTTSQTVEQLSITSPSFVNDEPIPEAFTCDGADVNPQLDISGLPSSANLAILIEDPDAPLGTWIHWLEYNIVAAGPTFIIGQDSGSIGTEGLNSWNLPGYGGPCPPPGETHRYVFKLVVLDEPLDLPAGAEYEAVMRALDDHTVNEAELVGVYGR